MELLLSFKFCFTNFRPWRTHQRIRRTPQRIWITPQRTWRMPQRTWPFQSHGIKTLLPGASRVRLEKMARSSQSTMTRLLTSLEPILLTKPSWSDSNALQDTKFIASFDDKLYSH